MPRAVDEWIARSDAESKEAVLGLLDELLGTDRGQVEANAARAA